MITFHILEVNGEFVASCVMNSKNGIGRMKCTFEADGQFYDAFRDWQDDLRNNFPGFTKMLEDDPNQQQLGI